jgi:aryl-alcohol dehydrogenase-like predicted oxidoreductase
MSRVGLGTWATFGDGVDFATARRIVFAALDAGINHIDTAPGYAGGVAEEWLGRLLAEADRAQIVVSTKAFFAAGAEAGPHFEGLSRKALFHSVEGSLRRLRCERIDLLYCHRADPDTPLEETIEALADLRRQGKIQAWGISRWPAQLTLQAVDLAGRFGLPTPAAAQEPYNRLHAAAASALKAELQSVPVPIVGYSILARGTLTGKYLREVPSSSRKARSRDCPDVWKTNDAEAGKIRRLLDLAERAGVSAASLMIADALRFGPCAAILTAASSPEQVGEIANGMALAQNETLTQDVQDIFRESAN